jgi:hypothetical protein
MDDYSALVTEKEKLKCLKKISPSATLPTINLTIINLESNLGLLSDRKATNVLC